MIRFSHKLLEEHEILQEQNFTNENNLENFQDRALQLEKQKTTMINEAESIHKDFQARFRLLDGEINSVSFRVK